MAAALMKRLNFPPLRKLVAVSRNRADLAQRPNRNHDFQT